MHNAREQAPGGDSIDNFFTQQKRVSGADDVRAPLSLSRRLSLTLCPDLALGLSLNATLSPRFNLSLTSPSAPALRCASTSSRPTCSTGWV